MLKSHFIVQRCSIFTDWSCSLRRGHSSVN